MKMSNSSLVNVKVPAYSGNYSIGRSGRKIEAITIHHMAGVLSAKRCGEFFQEIGRNASSHYGIGNDGEIGLYVDECNTAWTNDNWDSNCKSVTIETSNSSYGGQWLVGDKALKSLIKLVADIAKRNNLGTLVKGKNVTWHRMFSNTECPGDYLLSKMDYIISEANKINNGVPKPSNPSKPSTSSTTIKVGSIVKVKKGAKSYDGVSIAGFVYNNAYPVIEIVKDRAVLGAGLNTAFKVSDLYLNGSQNNTEKEIPIKVGDKVKVLKAVQYNGQPFTVYYEKYDVIEVVRDRVVIGIGKTVTCAINKSNLKKC